MRLEDNVNTAESALPSRSQRGANFRRMVTVIVNHADSRRCAFELEAAIHAAKGFERGANLFRGNIKRDADCYSGGCIQNVMHAGHMQRELA